MRILDAAVGPFERVVWAVDDDSGLQAIVAVHDTALGPALGGTRFHPYADEASACIDVLRLADGMTLKSAAAGLDVGGGKAVIIGDPARVKTDALLRGYARVLDLLGGTFYTAEDVGTTVADMERLRQLTPYVLGVGERIGGGGDPSPFTAQGVVAAMRAAWEAETGGATLAGARIVVQGVGKVGSGVVERAVAEGALVQLCDVDAGRAAALAARVGAGLVPVDVALAMPCDILAPCAMGGVISRHTVPALACRWVVGAANNQLTDDGVADLLAERGIGYVPDFVANAGGVISVAQERHGWERGRVSAAVEGVGETVRELIEESRVEGETPLACARRLAAERIALARA
jgi:glutamate dehydrogenase/leucine dehydrogenase